MSRDEAVKMLTKAQKAFEKYRDTYSTTYIGNMDHYISEALKALQSPPTREEDLRERLISKLQEMWSQMELGSISEMRLFSFIDQIEGILKPARAAEGDVSKNRQNLNISERHNEKSDDSQYVSVPKDALNELIRLVKYEAVVALEQSRMSVSLVEDIRNAIKAAEGENGC